VPLHVLVVDDVDINREIARGFLQAAGHHVTCAGSGAEAVDAVRRETFDAVLMDVRMPGMDGLEATRLIRNMPGAAQHVPILALTAQAFAEQVEACLAAGMNGHVIKPFNQETLLGTLGRLRQCPKTAISGQESHGPLFERKEAKDRCFSAGSTFPARDGEVTLAQT
jgi:CheY-like chemotaxis protein